MLDLPGLIVVVIVVFAGIIFILIKLIAKNMDEEMFPREMLPKPKKKGDRHENLDFVVDRRRYLSDSRLPQKTRH